MINSYVDEVMEKVMEKLSLKIPVYKTENDPILNPPSREVQHWNILKRDIKTYSKKYSQFSKDFKKRRRDVQKEPIIKKAKSKNGTVVKKGEIKQEDESPEGAIKIDNSETLKTEEPDIKEEKVDDTKENSDNQKN